MPDTVTEATDVVRGHIDRIVLTRVGDTLRAEFCGGLAVLASFAQAEEHRENSVSSGENPPKLSVVAGVGFEPTTFRL